MQPGRLVPSSRKSRTRGKAAVRFFFCLSKSKRKTETRIAIGQVLAVGRSARKDGGNHLRNVEGPIDRGTGPHSGITAR